MIREKEVEAVPLSSGGTRMSVLVPQSSDHYLPTS